jgi:2-dehydro-3-deoxyphosphogluconate aldolase / (4S)-4-hydroxy-2-oxoglutarate aldolase
LVNQNKTIDSVQAGAIALSAQGKTTEASARSLKREQDLPAVFKHMVARGPVVPVIVIKDIEQAIPLAEALLEAGLTVLEITLRTACALDAVSSLRKRFPELYIGAGTLRQISQVSAVVDAGAQFAVSPGYDPELGETCRKHGLDLLPGIASASELMQANRDGFYFVKLFPAEAIGGIRLIQSFASPFAETMFCPTGGIDVSKARDYLSLSNVACVGGSWMIPATALAAGDWLLIRDLASQAQALERAFTAQL